MDPEEIDFEQAACRQPKVGFSKQLAHKINLSQGCGQIFFACCLLQLSLRMGRPAAWWTRPGTSWSRRGCENPDQLVPGFNHQQSWHILLLTRTGWLMHFNTRGAARSSFGGKNFMNEISCCQECTVCGLGDTVPRWQLDGWQGHWLNRGLPICTWHPNGWSLNSKL